LELFDRPDGGELAVLVHIRFTSALDTQDSDEFSELVASAGAEEVAFISGSKSSPVAKYFVGSGKLEEIHTAVQGAGAEVVIFNHVLSPSQERNIEAFLSCRVLDRTRLILDIFAQRARTHEGKLQVELAQLQHMATRLVRGWTHLERQKGGIGLRGPGETQLESDRRMLRGRIKQINSRLDKVRSQRGQGRRSRNRADIATVALVGYTNAGKSTMFNQLCEAQVYVADQLFATLDPTLRRIDIPELGPIVLSDTVGFIKNLPHKLVEAFRATLEEAANAQLLLHVVDAADANRVDNIAQVEDVLVEIEADGIPCLQVYNKIDMIVGRGPGIDYDSSGKPERVWVSAHTGEGLALLQKAIAEVLGVDIVHKNVTIDAQHGRLRAKLYDSGGVLGESYNDAGEMKLEIRLPRHDLLRLLAAEHEDPGDLVDKDIWLN
jgi:GTP-binding protein HflX